MLFPKRISFRGKFYRLVEAVMPAKAAEVKMKSLHSAVARSPQARVVNADEWDMGEGGLLDLTHKENGGSPMLVMWNPVTSEMLISSDRDLGVVLHADLFKKYRGKLRDYPLPHFRDWGRATVAAEGGGARLWQWSPLFEHIMYLSSDRDRTEMERIHKEGLEKFKEVLQDLGITGSISVIRA